LANLQRGLQQQLIVATALMSQLSRNRCQLTTHRRHWQRALRDPAGLVAYARAIAGKQVAGDFLLVAAEGADYPEGIQVSGHGVFSPNGVTR
jgi:hypothetical protein